MNNISKTVISLIMVLTLVFVCAVCPSAYVSLFSSNYSFITMENSEPSKYGLITSKFIDENGNEVDFNKINTQKNSIPNTKYSTNAALPSSFDLRNITSLPDTRDQGLTSSCWVFAPIGVMEMYDVLHDNAFCEGVDYSEAHLAWFANNGHTTDTSDETYGDGRLLADAYGNGSGGNWLIASSALFRGSGIQNEINFPFYPYSLNSMGNYPEYTRYTNNGRVLYSAIPYLSMTEVKTALTHKQPVEMSFYFCEANTYYTTSNDCIYYNGTQTTSNHSVVVVGWNDNYPASNFPADNRPTANGAWLIRNNYGKEWGNDGYCWVSYKTTSLSSFIGYTTTDTSSRENTYQYDGAGFAGYASGNNMGMANIFKANGNELITSLGLFIAERGSSFTVSVYRNLPTNYSKPTNGNLVYISNTKTLQYSGYQTIPLDTEIEIKTGEIFSVIVQFSGTSYIPVERLNYINPITNISYTASTGESFLKNGSLSSWDDCVKAGCGNVSLKVFTRHNPNPTSESKQGAKVVTIKEFLDILMKKLSNCLLTFSKKISNIIFHFNRS